MDFHELDRPKKIEFCWKQMCPGDKKDDASIDIPGVTLFGIFLGVAKKWGLLQRTWETMIL